MKKLLLLSIIFSALTGAAFSEEAYEKGFQLYKQKRYKDALAFLDEAIVANPDWYFPVLLKGQCHFKLSQFDKALAHLNDCLTMEPPTKDIPSVKNFIAMSHMLKKDYPQAVQAFDSLLEVAPRGRRFDIYLNRGQCELQIAKKADGRDAKKAASYFKKSYVSFSEALKNPSNGSKLKNEALFQKSYAFYKQERESTPHLKKSIGAFEQVIAANPKDERAHRYAISLQLKVVEKASGDRKPAEYQTAVRHLDRYLKNWPNNRDMLRKKGLALQGAKQYGPAVETLARVAKMTPGDGKVHMSLGSCQMALKNYDAALASFRQAKANGEAKNPDVYLLSAFCEVTQKTGCAPFDIPIYENAVRHLEEGAKKASGSKVGKLRSDLNRKKNTLRTLRENLSADNQNHQATLKNIETLEEAIRLNTDRLSKNRDLYAQQPTEELNQAIEQGVETIRADKNKLEEEYKVLNRYIREAKKCGGGKSYEYYAKMTQTAQNKSG